MKRRELIQHLALITGAALSPSVVQAMINGIDGRINIQNPTLNETQRATCSVLAEMIIPRTDTPGAIDAGVPHFIELMVSDWYTNTERTIFLEGLATLNSYCLKEHGSPFLTCSQEDQIAALTHMEVLASGYKSKLSAMPFAKEVDEHVPFFGKLKELTVIGYYTSEVGAKQELIYQPMPMEYRDIEFREVGRQWSS
ncbi:gluconate 2-dehydrogenase subunit 3 family protein [Litorivivens sp.]|uniref:gluconate 2-dehydrogenase subunit 3 family protein n=1 Tax=Litorivivens sp. TaxID=2020868 RepID=UPI003568AB90